MSNIDDHTLNACLARVIGLRWGYCLQSNEHGYFTTNDEFVEHWDPLHDANQMEEVEAWLVEQGYSLDCHKWTHQKEWHFNLYHPNNSVSIKGWQGKDRNKKRAFALTVWEMEQSQKGGKGEDIL